MSTGSATQCSIC